MGTYQLGWTRLKEDGQDICYTSHTVNKAEQDNVIICEGRPRVAKEIEHREIHYRLNHCIEMIYRIFGKKIGQAAHSRSTFPPIL